MVVQTKKHTGLNMMPTATLLVQKSEAKGIVQKFFQLITTRRITVFLHKPITEMVTVKFSLMTSQVML